MLTETIRDYYAYAQWANNRVLQQASNLTEEQFFISDLDSVWSIHDTLVHMLAGQEVWLQRWQGKSGATLSTDTRFANVPALQESWIALDGRTNAFLDELIDEKLTAPSTYRNYRGDVVTTPLWKQMLHQGNHQTYHRGEVAALLSRFGHSPGDIDYSRYFLLVN